MTVPGRVEAARLLRSLDPPEWHLRHSRAVAEIAAWLARRASTRGIAVDRSLVEAAALLHDVDKLVPPSDPARRLSHGDGSAAWLARHGHPELDPVVRCHPVTLLADERGYAAWAPTATLEERLVAYADKRAGQRLQPMAERFASWRRRYPAGPGPDAEGWDADTADRVRERADRLEREICERLAIAPGDVRRLAWTAAALRAAARAERAA